MEVLVDCCREVEDLILEVRPHAYVVRRTIWEKKKVEPYIFGFWWTIGSEGEVTHC